MASHAEQHFVPRFLLEQWHTPPDEKLTYFRWTHGRLVSHRRKAKSVAKERHLYSMERSKLEPDVRVEKDLWGPHIDDPAALVHSKMLSSGIRELSLEDRKAWSPFLVSLMLRGPSMVRHIRERGREILSVGLDEGPDDYLEVRGIEPEATLRQWVEKHIPDVLDDVGVMALPELAFSQRLNLALLNVTWGIRSVRAARFNLMFSDRPLIVAGTLESSFLVALPISPTKIFIALNNEMTYQNIVRWEHDDFVRSANFSSVSSAERYVYATSARQESFVAKFLAPVN